MTEAAHLILKVDSTGAKSATGDLDKLTAASGKAEGKVGVLTGAYKAFAAVAASAAVAKTVGMYIRMADASANMSARLRLATKSQEEFNAAHRATFEIAQRSSTDLESVVDLYGKLAQSTGEIGLTQGQVLQMTETITQAFQISGATAQEAAGGLRQLSQAMAGGTLRAEEFNSIIESSPRIVQALADHFGVSFGRVRQLVNDGKVSSEEFAKAMLAAGQSVQSEFDKMPLTVGRATQKVHNALLNLVGGAEKAEGASADLASAIEGLGRVLESDAVQTGFTTTIGLTADAARGFGTLAQKIAEANSAYSTWLKNQGFAKSGSMDNTAQLDERIRGLSAMQHGNDPLNQVRRMFFGNTISEELQRAIIERNAMASAPSGEPDTWGLDAAPGVGRKPARASATEELKNRLTARKELTQAEKDAMQFDQELLAHEELADETRRDYALARIQRQQDDADAQTRARAATADLIEQMEFELSLIGLSNVEREKAIALRYADVDAASEQGQKISDLVEQMHKAAERGEDLRDFEHDARNLFSTIVSGSASASDAFGRFMDNMKARAADKLFDALLAGFGGMANGGGWAGFSQGFAGAFTGGGRAEGGPVMAGQSYLVGEKGRPEIFVPGQSGSVVPLSRGGGGGATNVKVEVINNGAPARVSTSRSRGADGTEIIKVLLDQVATDIHRGGTTAAAIKGRFGLREAV